MPIYTIRDNVNGKTLKVSGDRPPTPEEAASLFKSNEPNILQKVGNFLVPQLSKAGGAVVDAAGMVGDYAKYNLSQNPQSKYNAAKSFSERKKRSDEYMGNMGFATTKGRTLRPGTLAVGIAKPALEASSFLVPVGNTLPLALGSGALSGSMYGAAQMDKLEDYPNIFKGALGGLAGAGAGYGIGKGIGYGLGKLPKGNLFGRLGGRMESTANDMLVGGIGSPKQLEPVEGLAGRKAGKLLDDYKIYDRSPESIQAGWDNLDDAIDMMLSTSKNKGSTKKLFSEIDAKIKEYQSSSDLSDMAESQLDALIKRRSKIEKYLSDNNPEGFLRSGDAVPLSISPQSLRGIKRNIYRDVKPSAFNPSYNGSGSQLAAKDAYQALISTIEDAVPGTKQLGRDQMALSKLRDMAKAAENRGRARQPLNFSRLGSAGLGGIVAGVPGAIAAYAGEAVVNNPAVMGASSRVMRNAGKGIGQLKLPNIPNLGNIPERAARFGGAKLFTNPSRGNETTPPAQSHPQVENKQESPYMQSISNPPPSSTAQSGMIDPKSFYTAPKVPKITTNIAFGKTKKLKRSSAY